MTQLKRKPLDYWTALANSYATPNFWMTPEYVKFAELFWVEKDDLCGWKYDEDEEWFCPPLGLSGFRIDQPTWAGFLDLKGNMGNTLLDHQYLYDAYRFQDLSGSIWKTFRKNIRKYPARYSGQLKYRRLVGAEYEQEIGEMLLEWSEDKIIQDPEVMTQFILLGKFRWGLFLDEKLVGINVGDANHAHAIYRYCLDDGSPFLNEYLRYCFYLDPWTQVKRWVNDGGDLGDSALARFKRKLNPAVISNVYTWKTDSKAGG